MVPTTICQTTIPSDDSVDSPIPLGMRVYFRERLRNRLYELVISEFDSFKRRGHSQADLARKIDMRKDQLCRLLSGPGNMTVDTVSDLLLGLSGAELSMLLDVVVPQPKRTQQIPNWLKPMAAQIDASNSIASNGIWSISSGDCVVISEVVAPYVTAQIPSIAETKEEELA